ncbi:calreticulin-3 [Suncus etruscus]|uniref:calreticulin-3 n=1 Tax=Suncus etruscus TaxID=109475 RepID=UPI00210FF015|nr:calreticulin-3 [Suncus etruscus]
MAPPRVALGALFVLRAALAAVYFQEQFLDGEHWRNRWVPSTNDSGFGHFRLSSGKFYGHIEKDKGLQTTQDSRFYAISARFPPFSSRGRPLVLQYTVKHEQKMDCGGGYVKVFPAGLDQRQLNNKSPYYIMFGPDICGFDITKVHVILQFKNQYHENKKSIRCKVDGYTHLYTLVLRPDLSYEVRIDGQVAESGDIEYDWNLESLKSSAKKTGTEQQGWEQKDWDKQFLEAGAGAPSDWNSKLDGDVDLQAPLLQKPPYQDGLKPEGIDSNVWLHRKPKDANYLAESDLTEFDDIGAIGLELWQVRSGTIFDNFLITDDEEYAQKFGKATWGETKGPEKEMDEIQGKEEMKLAREQDEAELPRARHGQSPRFPGFPGFGHKKEL